MNGLESPHKLFTTYIKYHTTCNPGNLGRPFNSTEPELTTEIRLSGFDWDRLDGGKLNLQHLLPFLTKLRSGETSGSSGDCTIPLDKGGNSDVRTCL